MCVFFSSCVYVCVLVSCPVRADIVQRSKVTGKAHPLAGCHGDTVTSLPRGSVKISADDSRVSAVCFHSVLKLCLSTDGLFIF